MIYSRFTHALLYYYIQVILNVLPPETGGMVGVDKTGFYYAVYLLYWYKSTNTDVCCGIRQLHACYNTAGMFTFADVC